MNIFNRFIVTALLVLFTSKAFATSPIITKIERINVNTILVTFDQGIKPVSHFDVPIEGEFSVKLYTSTTYYLGSSNSLIVRTPTAVNPNDNGFATQWQWEEPTLTATDNDGLSEITINLNAYHSDFENDIGHSSLDYINTLNLIWQHDLSITSINTLDTNEGTNLEHTLIASDTAATFSIIENTSGLFSLSGTNNATLSFDGTNTDYESTTKSYTVKIKATTGNDADENTEQTLTVNIKDVIDTAPVIRRFTISQGVNQGRLIIKTDTSVTVYAEASGGSSYTWSSSDFSVIGSGAFVTFIPNADVGTRTIKLKVTIGDYSSERVLKLKLVESHPTDWKDKNNNGINDSKEIGRHNNELLVGENKKITSPINTRLLLGIMSEDTAHLTLAQMKKYRTDNNLSDNTEDTLTTGDIYDYVVENFSATTQVIIELTSPIPANAILRKYSPATGWANFVINDNNIQSKTSNTCTDDTHWQTGLTTGATCLKLTIKDGSENDTDGDQNNGKGQVNGVVESTISIAIPAASNSNNNNNSGGGCVYNPNAPARFDMGFILLMTLSAYYLIRRRRCFNH
ncbi:hypothetical protein BTHERMOSOX_1737 [Bathymodiolus thermophilus thioautotrophic gill symbiont]|uniref:JDVT-CTERM domain-containing protein n=1 Tax=Bathymodiolus thermophilus thioautotrophic gill symbiont TaxID=2360 RepID=UPI0010B86F53|nr:JDVT-CTERM domain-containing protein [Bathymodiolus thermophilus thioautotrophic gill symbiont]SGZ98820.1 hypothetical protein BTHERMOSOX_1737 [Bathymodiolus thermophilus thioautotrophic gill symbiont]